jgi:hypothetical protein
MGAEVVVSSSEPRLQQLEKALDDIGVTPSHKKILALILFGVLFDVFEQNAVGLVGPLLREYWGLPARRSAFSIR